MRKSATWTSSDPTIAPIATDGSATATGMKAGVVTITAKDSATGLIGMAKLTVSSAVLKSISVTPASALLPKGTTQAFVATGTFSDATTKDLTKAVTWASSNASVAIISNA